ncbi:23S rRNA (guanosine(2251)-2'-O)-methyltransferase RlmB [Papillibacter cinnamivorans]|uniref:23S rRNA (Guanosine2251-2'-O)-methyltransferase n=1 Tax=Papillibacter cinnamivorans DSM 12816 TaxID=1122930 RepID=A0A1W2BVI2_9FIRM|nr:23S rRNA (guanosine(2251)-2'-O)-methyltransferase RlmB [Papillibacter cinnamivorans]SMC77005.1 23S rRNA (guanosine2251-2'-O)-methyltransferase [Papillibacter cinnamivorans DSM 12816]
MKDDRPHNGGTRANSADGKTHEAEGPLSAEADGIIEGRNAVLEALRAGTAIDKLYVSRGETDRTLGRIVQMAREKGVPVSEADRRKLDAMSRTRAHQGVIAVSAVREYATVEDILNRAREKGEPPLVVICDEITDPQNLGAIVRTCECAGAHGVILPKRRSAGLTASVAKASAGAISYVPVARVSNLSMLLRQLKQQGIWIFGAAAGSDTPLYRADFKGPAAIVIGSEGTGMSRLVEEGCDFTVSIPLRGEISSLNASAAAAVLLYEAVRQRTT